MNLNELEQKAKNILSESVWNYVSSFAGNGGSYKNNLSKLKELQLIPRVLKGIGNINTETSIFNQQYKLPFIISPMAYQQLIHPGVGRPPCPW